jgi:hypothetical protein
MAPLFTGATPIRARHILRLTARHLLRINYFVLKPNQARTFVFLLVASLPGIAGAAVPYTQATVTRHQNKVTYGSTADNARRPAQTGDIIKAASYLLTETDSRAELKYEDGSLVRIGQNTVFTFEADTRTLSLEKGALVFYIPKGSGGGTVRTASITAAITGTIGKVTENIVAILEGEVTLVPSGQKVPAGYFARANFDGTITVQRFDVDKALGGVLMDFNGPIPTFDETKLRIITPPTSTRPEDLMAPFDKLDRTGNLPGEQETFFPEIVRPPTRPNVPPPGNRPGKPDGQY